MVFSIADQAAPTISCPANIVTASTTVSWVVSSTDNFDTSPQVSCNPASGSTFNAGTTSVTCTSTDNAGNSASCTFTVTIGM